MFDWLSRRGTADARTRRAVVLWGLPGSGHDALAECFAELPGVEVMARDPAKGVDESIAPDAFHVFCHRRHAFLRLLQLHDTPAAAAAGTLLPVDAMYDDERRGIAALDSAWRALVQRGVRPQALVWEDFTPVRGEETVAHRLAWLLQQGGIGIDDRAVARCAKRIEVLAREAHNAEPAWWNRGRAELEKRLGRLPPFAPGSETEVRREPADRLVIDVGANDGADTGYYLGKGFRCVSVEAIPQLAEALRIQYPAPLAAGRLVIEPMAIAATEGETEFLINDEWTEWSSAHGASKASAGSGRLLRVPTTTLRTIIERHGKPYYVKIDIEGGETDAVRSLQGLLPALLPDYLSVEVNMETAGVLRDLHALGFDAFQVVRQGAEHLPVPPSPSREGLDLPCRFSDNMSGPFARDLPEDRWLPLDQALTALAALLEDMQAGWRQQVAVGWYDIHARRSP